jgi:hypothetical protein
MRILQGTFSPLGFYGTGSCCRYVYLPVNRRLGGDTIVNDAIHIKVQIVEPSVSYLSKDRECTLGYCCPQ